MADRNARLRARAGAAPDHASAPGPATHRLKIAASRNGLLHVPAGLKRGEPAPLLVMLHGAGGDAGHSIPMVVAQAEARDALVLAPQARAGTWDVIRGGYDLDVDYIDEALQQTFAWFPVSRVAIGGFSDGASYALSLGLANGDLFSDVLAFSPGFMAPDPIIGEPRVFISHGDDDRVLPIAKCGRPLSQRLKRAGYDVDYREFDGGHTAPGWAVDAAFARFLS